MKHDIKYHIKNNYVVRNVVMAISLIIIIIISSFLFLDIYTKHGQSFSLPNLSGMTIEEAQMAVEKLDSRLVVTDSLFIPSQKAGVVLEQNPKPGSLIKSNRRVLLTVNTMKPKQITMPYVAGFSIRQAKNRLVSLGLGISRITYISDIATNNVIEQKYKGVTVEEDSKETIEVGSELELIVGLSDSAKTVKVPDLTMLSAIEAKSLLWENGFNVGSVVLEDDINHLNIDDAIVFSQTILPQTRKAPGSTVGFTLTIDTKKAQEIKKYLLKRKGKLDKINDKMEKYKDTLKVISNPKGNSKIENEHGIVTIQDTAFYRLKIDNLTDEYNEIINNIHYEQ